jgi:hypothetical protein
VFGHFFRCAAGDDLAAFGAGFGADVDEVVGLGKDVGMMLDDDDGVTFIDGFLLRSTAFRLTDFFTE